MGMSAELQLERRFLPGRKTLFTRKTFIPFGWYLFFVPDDFVLVQKRAALKRALPDALTRARARVEALTPIATPRFIELLQQLIRSVEASGNGELVLDSLELGTSRTELLAPLAAFTALEKTPGRRSHLAKLEKAFIDHDGLTFEGGEDEDDDPRLADFGDKGDITGWPVQAKQTGWFDASPPPPPPVPARVAADDAALAAIYAEPDDVGRRKVYADQLVAKDDPHGEFILLDCLEQRTAKQERRREKLRDEYDFSAPFNLPNVHVRYERGFPAFVSFKSPPPAQLLGHAAWATVHTVEATSAVELLAHPAMKRVQRVTVSAADVVAFGRLGRPLPFRSICFTDDNPAAWQALASVSAFPELVEVFLQSISVWLPPGAQKLLEVRPQLNLCTGHSPSIEPSKLVALTAEQHAARIARWADPGGKLLAGPRSDNSY